MNRALDRGRTCGARRGGADHRALGDRGTVIGMSMDRAVKALSVDRLLQDDLRLEADVV